jgi:MSHA biogenesis protein MshP
MCRNHDVNISNRLTQAGFSLPLALFLVVGLGFLALGITRSTTANKVGGIYEVLSVQAFFAAESGAGYGLHQVLFDVSSMSTADARCVSLNGQTLNFNATGLSACSATLSCTLSDSVNPQVHIYDITSLGRCGEGDLTTERSIRTATSFEN